MAEPWRPRWVVEVELSALPSRLVVPSVSSDGGGAAGTRYRAARVLVRVQGEPIGVVNVALDADELPLAIVLVVSFVFLGWRSGLVVATSVPRVLAVVFVVMNVAGAAVTAIVALGAGRLRALVVTRMIVASGSVGGVIMILMHVALLRCGLSPRQNEVLLRTGGARRNLIAKRTDGLLDLVPPGLSLIQRQAQAFRHDANLDAAYPRQARHRILDLGRAGPAVHARHRPVTGCFACSFRHRHSSCR